MFFGSSVHIVPFKPIVLSAGGADGADSTNCYISLSISNGLEMQWSVGIKGRFVGALK